MNPSKAQGRKNTALNSSGTQHRHATQAEAQTKHTTRINCDRLKDHKNPSEGQNQRLELAAGEGTLTVTRRHGRRKRSFHRSRVDDAELGLLADGLLGPTAKRTSSSLSGEAER